MAEYEGRARSQKFQGFTCFCGEEARSARALREHQSSVHPVDPRCEANEAGPRARKPLPRTNESVGAAQDREKAGGVSSGSNALEAFFGASKQGMQCFVFVCGGSLDYSLHCRTQSRETVCPIMCSLTGKVDSFFILHSL